MRALLAMSLLLSVGGAAYADEKPVLPEDAPEMLQLKSACQVCHTLQYVTQQRLTEPQWKKTVDKMIKFGAPVPPTETARLVAFLSARLTIELTDPAPVRVATPEGALPKKAAHK